MVLHDRAEAWALADRLIVLLDGRLAAQGEPRAVLERPPSRAVATFLGFTGRGARERRRALRAPGAGRARPRRPLHGTVARRIPEEDGVLCDVARRRRDRPGPPPPSGARRRAQTVRLRLDGGVHFADGAG